MKKIVYVITSPSHQRVFESLNEISGVEQIIIGPKPIITSDIFPEDYGDFNIKNIITFSSIKEISGMIDKINPNILVQSSLPLLNSSKKFKKVYVSHGAVGNHVIEVAKKAKLKVSDWNGFDAYCGITEFFRDWIKFAAKSDNVFLDILPQLDMLYKKEYYEKYRNIFLQKNGIKDVNKIILFCGFCCKDRYDFDPNNEDYFRTSIELGRLALKNNWLVLIKPRQIHKKNIQFLKAHKWGKQYLSLYSDLHHNKNVRFITTSNHIYRYFFADSFVINGTSTVEIESILTKKPLIIVRTKYDKDPFRTSELSVAEKISDVSGIENAINESFVADENIINNYLNTMGITFDGCMNKRLQKMLLNM